MSIKIEKAIHAWFRRHKKTLALAESCTGGLMAAHLVALPGASDYFLGSFVTYSDGMKKNILGVKAQTLKTAGAVSEEAVREMLAGIFHQTKADYGIAVTGIAGPTGGSAHKPIGMICYALGKRGQAPEVGTFISKAKTRQTIILSTTYRLFDLLWREIQ